MIKYLKLLIASLLVGMVSQAQVVTTLTITPGSIDGICIDALDNIYCTESDRVQKINSTLSVFAGYTSSGSVDGQGTAASFNNPEGICTDPSGNIYVADRNNNKIRKITSTGYVSTFAGSGIAGSTDGNSTSARFTSPISICSDPSGNIYVLEFNKNGIRKITPTGVVSTFATGGLLNPLGICSDISGNIYVASAGSNTIFKYDPTGNMSTLAGSGTAGSTDNIGVLASFNFPWGICADASGNIYVADRDNNKIRKITASGVVTTIAGSGTAGSTDGIGVLASFSLPKGICISASGILYVNDYGNNKIRKITLCSTPNAPTNTTTAPLLFCAGNTTSLTAISTGTVSWYNNPTGGIAISTGTTIVTSASLTAGTYTYYAEASTCTISATRTAITITINPTPTITVNSGTICSGNSFTISPGGASTYTINGGAFVVNPATNSSYTVTGQSTDGCINTAVATVSVNSTVIPAILISTASNTICGSSAVFSSTITNGGSAPTYQWKKNGSNVGSNISTYSPTGLLNGDVVYCELTSNLSCASPTAVSSNSITMTVSSFVMPAILISTTNNTICGSSATFSSTITNGGSAPTYQWKKNGSNVGSNISTYSPTGLQNGDVISCRLTSNLSCASPTAVNSNSMTITVNPTPTVTISSSNTLICVGETASLTANGAATYSWSSGSNASVIVINPTNTTTYTVTGTTAAGCSATGSFTQTVNLCTSIEQFNTTLFNVYPNPSNGVFTVYSSSEASITIVNVLGELVYTNKLDKGDHTIDLFEQPNGIYFIQVQTNSIKNQIRLLKTN